MRSVHSPATGAMPCGRRYRRRAGSLRNWTHPRCQWRWQISFSLELEKNNDADIASGSQTFSNEGLIRMNYFFLEMCIVQLWLGILSQIMPLLRKYKKVKSTAVNNNLLGLLEKTVTIIFLLLELNLRKHLACVSSANVTLPALRACVLCVNIYASSLRCVRCLAGNVNDFCTL